MRSILVEAAGVLLVAGGVAALWWPGALIIVGLYLVAAGVALGRADRRRT